MERLAPLREAFVIGVVAVIFIIVMKAAAAGLPDGGFLGATKKVALGV